MVEFIWYDIENDNNYDSWGYIYLYGVGFNFLEIYYCYYKGKFLFVSGIFV